MDTRSVWCMFEEYNRKYFWTKLDKVKLSWSPRMTLCAGKTAFKVWSRGGTSCSIRLSQPLLSQRPRSDTVNTLLHEMIHAYLHVTQGLKYRDSHGAEFKSHMKRINSQEGSKITIYHYFRKEVDKYRVNVYKCDGPCVSKRPFFGILRRAIERPPGPVDKWWARHQLECGGTFHKIEGSGVSSNINKDTKAKASTAKRKNYKESKMSQNSAKGFRASNSTDKNWSPGVNSTKRLNIPQNQSVPSSRRIQRGGFSEEAVLKRIRGKYANVKQTIMLSKEELGENRRHYRHPAPFGNYVQGNVNYRYQCHTPSQIKLEKYLSRYREAKKSSGSLVLNNSSSKSCTFSQDFENTCSSKSGVSEVPSGKNRQKYRYPAPFGNYMQGNVNYRYQSHTPSQIKLEKYLSRYREAKKSSGSLSSSSKSCTSSHHFETSSKSGVSGAPSGKSRKINPSKKGKNKRVVNYDCHSKTPDQVRLENYINRFRVADSCQSPETERILSNSGSSSKSKIFSLNCESGFKSGIISQNSGCSSKPAEQYNKGSTKKQQFVNEVSPVPGTSKTTVCPICNIQIPVKEYDNHLGECFGNELDFDADEEVPKKGPELNRSTSDNTKARKSSWKNLSDAVNCANCGSEILVDEMKLHLRYCINSDDETDAKDSSHKSLISERSRGKDSGIFVSCPSCNEKVREKHIHEHLDECLTTFLDDEF